MVAKWITKPATNHGVLLRDANENLNGYALLFRSSDDGQPEQPELEITWEQPLASVYYVKDHPV